jgi:hypothetical protein
MVSAFKDSAHNACRFVEVGRLVGFLLHTSAFGRSSVWGFSQEVSQILAGKHADFTVKQSLYV